MGFAIRRAGHVVLNVADVARTLRFLEELIGFQIAANIGPFYFLTANAISNHHMIAIRALPDAAHQPDPARDLGMVSVSYEVIDLPELARLRARIERHGAAFGAAVVDVRRRGARSTVVCADPDGNRLEFGCSGDLDAAPASPDGALRQPARIRATGYLTLRVRDMARSRAFFEGFLRMHAAGGDEHGRQYFAGSANAPQPQLALEAGEPGAALPRPRGTLGMDHFAFELGSFAELQAAYRHFKETATPIHHVVDHGVTLSLYFNDPDGNLLEVYHDVPRAEYADPAVPFSGSAPLEARLVAAGATPAPPT